ncbi:MAG: hypothetical protein QOH13_2046 [Thermoleophilaceae bacterium]|nr:hypothetical protein [Thermoleophilaceae bacterium]
MAQLVRRWPPIAVGGVACVALAALSLLLPSGLTYDPYAWLLWGRDLAHLDLATGGTGTSWKPLPALVAALLAPLGRGAAPGWLLVARAGALFACFMAFRLAWRVAGPGRRTLAGVVALATIGLTREWFRRNGVGDAEGLMAAFGLLAIDRHLDARRGQAFGLLVAAGLIRVEVWPFAFAYGAWLWFASERPRRLAIAAGALLVPLLWFGGDWIGSGHLASASSKALVPIKGSPGASPHPAWAVAVEAFHLLPPPAWIAVAAAVVCGVLRERLLLVLAGSALVWTAVVAAMAQRGYPGLPRFLFGATALEAVLAGVGAARIVDVLAVALERRAPQRVAVALSAALVCVAFAVGAAPDAARLPGDATAIKRIADLDTQLSAAVVQAGGAKAVLRCGSPDSPWYTVTAVDWELGVGSVRPRPAAHGPRPDVFVRDRTDWDVRRGCGRPATQSARLRAPRRRGGAGSSRHGRPAGRT